MSSSSSGMVKDVRGVTAPGLRPPCAPCLLSRPHIGQARASHSRHRSRRCDRAVSPPRGLPSPDLNPQDHPPSGLLRTTCKAHPCKFANSTLWHRVRRVRVCNGRHVDTHWMTEWWPRIKGRKRWRGCDEVDLGDERARRGARSCWRGPSDLRSTMVGARSAMCCWTGSSLDWGNV